MNCRPEMALSDALQKPIILLLLEEASTWPPAGPMAMVFAEKPYIGFRRSTNHIQTEKPQRHLTDMQRPTTAMKQKEKKLPLIRSAPVIPQSRACSLM
ncbi:unnamed protein product [Rotaria sp. Silwood2]|nr:unnamed protein product [Rotaria sp. Silwood2]